MPVPDDLDEKKNEADGCSGSNVSQQDANDVSMPICFLVKEQAKSLIAIQVDPFLKITTLTSDIQNLKIKETTFHHTYK